MNTIILFALALLAPSQASADFDDDMGPGSPRVTYLSWCAKNLVMEARGNAEPVLKFNCEASGLVCAQQERFLGGARVVYAFCRAQR